MVGAFVRERRAGRAQGARAGALGARGPAATAPDALPGGLTTLELRLMELARCLATAPRLVLLDEPLAGLSADGVDVMIAMIRRVRAARRHGGDHRAHDAGAASSSPTGWSSSTRAGGSPRARPARSRATRR